MNGSVYPSEALTSLDQPKRSSAESASQHCDNHICDTEHGDTYDWDRFVRTCKMLGMSKDAPYGWAQIHVKPHVALLVCICSDCVAMVILAILNVGGVPWGVTLMNVLGIASTASHCCGISWLWRMGPMGAKAPFYAVLSVISTISLVMMVVAALAGPIRFTPFQDRLLFVVADAVSVFAKMWSGLNGSFAADHPPEPYTSIWPSMTNAAFTSSRLVDSLTDIGFVRILLTQVSGCQSLSLRVPWTVHSVPPLQTTSFLPSWCRHGKATRHPAWKRVILFITVLL